MGHSWTAVKVTHFADLAMVSVLGLLLEVFPLLEHLGVGEGDPVDPLEGLHVRATLPVCGRVLVGERTLFNNTHLFCVDLKTASTYSHKYARK